MKTIKNKTCRMCSSNKFETVVNLGNHPLVNSLITKKNLKKKDPVFPLHVKQCKSCKLVQLVEVIDANEIYKNVEYLYFSSDMPNLDKYFRPYANELQKRFLTKKNELVVEIGSNDGIMLQFFKKSNKILGVDPSTNVVLRALKKGITTVPDFFTKKLSQQIKNEWGQAKIIYGNNCIAHLNDVRDLIEGVDVLLRDDGVFIIECNYWGGMVDNINYSLIYHDHFSYFSIEVWNKFLKKYKMNIFDATVTPAQGGSLRLFISKNKRTKTKRLNDLLKKEKITGLNTYKKSLEYRANVNRISNKLRKIVEDIKKKGLTVAGYGAAAKGLTILKCSKLGKKHISYFVDDSPAKQGFYTPVDHIPIISRKEANKKLPDYFIILAPNYSDVIIEKESEFIKKGGKFIIPKNEIKIV
jgi:SAM-dependent methyltransferase|tara:strand:+ start:4170 stop:5405 length:1236 start_codon:yes stop_codon:yes gene_type:complete